MKLSRLSFWVVFLFCIFVVTTGSQAASVKDRMAARIPAINALMDQGVLGENNQGYLEYRAAKVQEQLVAEENSDRSKVYNAIGKKQGAPADLVGQRRAKMIAENGKKGRWYQKADGAWYQK